VGHKKQEHNRFIMFLLYNLTIYLSVPVEMVLGYNYGNGKLNVLLYNKGLFKL